MTGVGRSHSRARSAAALALSAAGHLLVIALAPRCPSEPRARPDEPVLVVELHPRPSIPAEAELTLRPLAAPALPPPAAAQARPPRPRPQRPAAGRRRARASAALIASDLPQARTPPSRLEPPEEGPAEPSDEPAEEAPDEPGTELLTPAEVLRRQAVRGLSGLDDEGQDRRRVARRTDQMARDALPPPIDDPPGFPELLPDDDGNMTWYFYYLVAKIRPDGSVFFEIDHSKMALAQKTGRYCHELAVGLDRCRAQKSVPWPEDWGQPWGDFPQNPIKRWFLRQTRAYRDHLAELDRRQRLSRSPSKAAGHAAAVWRDTSRSPAERRRLLFELWDECHEPRGADDDRPEAAAGHLARDQILGLIRRSLPRSSALAYSEAELRRLNAVRQSRQPFRPYSPVSER